MKPVNLFVTAASFSLLAACASSAPPISAGSGNHSENVPATVSAAPPAAVPTRPKELKDEKFSGYQLVGIGDQQRYCRTEYATGSRVDKTTICLTKEQLERQQANTRNYIQGVQNGGALGQPCTTGLGGGAVGCQ
jgi:hypothetical protein